MSSSVPYDPYIPTQGDSQTRTAQIQAVCIDYDSTIDEF